MSSGKVNMGDRSEKNLSGHLSRRAVLQYGAYAGMSALSAPLWLTGCAKRTAPAQANIILIVLDTLRVDHLGCYGYNRPTSPAIDKLASESVIFEDASATSPWTLPSHGSLLTGFYPSRLGLNDQLMPLPQDAQTLAMMLSRSGFASSAVVNSLYLDRKFGFDRGFQKFSFIPESQEPQGAAPQIIDIALKWLRGHRKDRFFLFLHFFDVHSDYRSLRKYREQFTSPYYGQADGSTRQLTAFREGNFSIGPNDLKYLIGLYDAQIRQIDDELKKLFSFLESQDLLTGSFLIVTSDHGEEFLDHGGVLHGRTHYQELIHVPLIIRGPAIPPGRRITEMVSLVDITPTLLDIAGIIEPIPSEGLNLRPLLQTAEAKLQHRAIFSEADHKNTQDDIKRAIRHPRYKLHYDLLSKKFELYDLARDPKESNNIASSQTSVVQTLFEELKSFMANKKSGANPVILSPDEKNKLKSLGYL